MIDKKVFDDLSDKLIALFPEDLKEETKKNIQSVMTATFEKFDLVTREEFDVQAKVLARTREKMDALEQKLSELEQS